MLIFIRHQKKIAMKKLFLSLTVLAAIGFYSCSSNDDENSASIPCVTCVKEMAENFTLCNDEGQAVVGGTKTGETYDSTLSNALASGYTCN